MPHGAFAGDTVPVETKFNPNHDPENGQFTFGSGARMRTRKEPSGWTDGGFTGGGGGSTGGGGASGSWTVSSRSSRDVVRRAPDPRSAAIGAAVAAAMDTEPKGEVVTKNGYTYRLDASERTTSVTGTLTLTSDQQRSRRAQANAGGGDRLPSDDGGHFIAARFNGPTDTFNHFAQDANFNRGAYRVLENKWAADVKDGKQVRVAITPFYMGSSHRPQSIRVDYVVNGNYSYRSFPNNSKGKTHGK